MEPGVSWSRGSNQNFGWVTNGGDLNLKEPSKPDTPVVNPPLPDDREGIQGYPRGPNGGRRTGVGTALLGDGDGRQLTPPPAVRAEPGVRDVPGIKGGPPSLRIRGGHNGGSGIRGSVRAASVRERGGRIMGPPRNAHIPTSSADPNARPPPKQPPPHQRNCYEPPASTPAQ